MKVFLVVGARPNFMKIAPIIRELKKYSVEYRLIHTGQHYDENMSDVFFKELNIPMPDINFGVGSLSHTQQTAEIMVSFESLCESGKPDVVLVVGDINSTVACALVVSKMKDIKLAHVEAGLRSFDREMPEEINRMVTDILSDYLFCTTQEAIDNLLKEGISLEKTYLVGDVMIDNLLYNLSLIKDIPIINEDYVLLTLHRPSNTDIEENLKTILRGVKKISKKIKVVFPIHPRTKKQINVFDLDNFLDGIDAIEPLSYLKFLGLMRSAKVVLTDSGSIQSETTFLNVPCITLRENTEHTFTLTEGTNVLVGANEEKLLKEFSKIYNGFEKKTIKNNLYDGKAAKRVVKILMAAGVDENVYKIRINR